MTDIIRGKVNLSKHLAVKAYFVTCVACDWFLITPHTFWHCIYLVVSLYVKVCAGACPQFKGGANMLATLGLTQNVTMCMPNLHHYHYQNSVFCLC